MSSFDDAHHMYLFALKSGGRKLTYGKSPEDAFEVLALRLTPEEVAELIKDDYIMINQRKMQDYVHLLK
jgi:hypothetical protein